MRYLSMQQLTGGYLHGNMSRHTWAVQEITHALSRIVDMRHLKSKPAISTLSYYLVRLEQKPLPPVLTVTVRSSFLFTFCRTLRLL